MTKSDLKLGQRAILAIIQELEFGVIERVSVRDGEPLLVATTRIIEEVTLASSQRRHFHHGSADFTLTREFECLFDQLKKLQNGTVDIQIRHSRPFRLIIHRHEGCQHLVAPGESRDVHE